MSRETADAVVVGAGIVGASAAYQLALKGLSVVVVEKEAAPAMGSTGRSAAGVRTQFTNEANIGLSLFSLSVFREFEERHGFEVGYRDIGYLLLVPHDRWDVHLDSVRLQQRMGAPVDVLRPGEAQRFVDFETSGLAGATYGPWDGVVDPHRVTGAWVSLGRDGGVDFRMDSPVHEVRREGGAWTLKAGSAEFSCGTVVNAAGAWSGQVARLAGLDVPVRPKRIQIFLSAPVNDSRVYPLTIDVETGIYLRSEGDRVLFGLDDLERGFGFTEGVDWAWLEEVLLRGVRRFPWWNEMGVDRGGSWWGYYAVTPDNSPVIGIHPREASWVDACGFSGHGIMHSPATGVAVAELVAQGSATTVDVSAFCHERFEERGDGSGSLAAEANVF